MGERFGRLSKVIRMSKPNLMISQFPGPKTEKPIPLLGPKKGQILVGDKWGSTRSGLADNPRMTWTFDKWFVHGSCTH